jgi:SPP1 family predicted phage head-tail adaptor
LTPATFDPGWLRERVTIETATATADGAGGASLAWSTLATVWARVEPVAADEKAVAGHESASVTHLVTTRYRDDVTGHARVTFRGRVFRILAAYDPDETRRYLVLKTAEEAP